jgi:hypothetical protein
MIYDIFVSAASLYQMEALCGQPEGTSVLLFQKHWITSDLTGALIAQYFI